MIRQYRDSDIERMLEIWLEASCQAHNFIPFSFWKERMEDMRTRYIPSGENYVFVAEGAEEVVAFISLQANYIAALFVDPKQQRKGIGRELLNFVKESHSRLLLSVYAENVDSIRFYLKQNFQIIGESREEHTGQREFLMEYPQE